MIVIERPREVGQPRRKVWCNKADLTAQGESYVFNDLAQDALGFGSIVFVVDEPGLVLWYDNESGEMYERVLGSGGGSSVTVEPLSVTANGTYTAESGKAFGTVTVNVPQVSGNPNYVETISGTLANPWGEYAASELFSAARGGELTMYISASVTYSESGTAETATMMFFPISGLPTFGFTKPGASADSLRFARVGYGTTGTLKRAVSGNISTLDQTQELLQIPGDAACTLTIIHHPLTGTMQMAESATFGGNA